MDQELDPDVEWITTAVAAEILHVSRNRVRQLANRDLLPCVQRHGRRYFRRPQVQVIANARDRRWHCRRLEQSGEGV
jgi:hypothetical protein